MKRIPVMVAALTSVLLASSAWIYAAQSAVRTTAAQTQPSPQFTWPAAVEAAFKQKYPKATVKGVFAETVAGKKVYEVESIDAGRRRDLDYNADGTVIRYEEEVTEADMPAAVAAAIKARYPRAVITLRERLYVAQDNSLNFELQLTNAGVTEVVLTPDGTWVTPPAGR